MRDYLKLAAAGAIAACAFAVTATSASAAIACNREGECWHVRGHYEYRPEFGVVIHPDNWRWRRHERFTWREHEGRGYWRNGIWVEF
jgi:hypothetical protein